MAVRRAVPTIPWQELPETYRSILRDLGHTKQTYEKIQQADALLHEVNRSMRRRKGSTKYCVGSVTGPPSIIWKRR